MTKILAPLFIFTVLLLGCASSTNKTTRTSQGSEFTSLEQASLPALSSEQILNQESEISDLTGYWSWLAEDLFGSFSLEFKEVDGEIFAHHGCVSYYGDRVETSFEMVPIEIKKIKENQYQASFLSSYSGNEGTFTGNLTLLNQDELLWEVTHLDDKMREFYCPRKKTLKKHDKEELRRKIKAEQKQEL